MGYETGILEFSLFTGSSNLICVIDG